MLAERSSFAIQLSVLSIRLIPRLGTTDCTLPQSVEQAVVDQLPLFDPRDKEIPNGRGLLVRSDEDL